MEQHFELLEPVIYKYSNYFSKVMNLNESRVMNQTQEFDVNVVLVLINQYCREYEWINFVNSLQNI